MRSNGENIAKETSNKLSENRKSFGHLCKKSPHASPGSEKTAMGKFQSRTSIPVNRPEKTPLPY